jgi:alpha-soluble NSF attachment protein
MAGGPCHNLGFDRQASACLLKVAHYAALVEQYDRAIEVYERVATKSLDNQLTKWSVREYLLKAGICLLCTKVRLCCMAFF